MGNFSVLYLAHKGRPTCSQRSQTASKMSPTSMPRARVRADSSLVPQVELLSDSWVSRACRAERLERRSLTSAFKVATWVSNLETVVRRRALEADRMEMFSFKPKFSLISTLKNNAA